MTGRRDVFDRIAAALERLAPPVAPPQDWEAAPAYFWDGICGTPVAPFDALPTDVLRGIDEQKAAVLNNLSRHANKAAAHDMLLWGARGMGKSALIRSTVAQLHMDNPGSIALVQVDGSALDSVPGLLKTLGKKQRAFLVFIDDLGFAADDTRDMLTLRSLLDGGVMPRPANVRIAVTSNRRTIVARDANEADVLHERDERDDALALADRFGLTVGFHPCDRATYLDILKAYTDPLGLIVDEEEALAFAIARGNRSGRSAFQYATELAGRAGLSL